MTTKVEIFAGNGHAVDVTAVPSGGKVGASSTSRIEAGKHGTAYVHAHQDLLIHEVSKGEDAPAANASIEKATADLEAYKAGDTPPADDAKEEGK